MFQSVVSKLLAGRKTKPGLALTQWFIKTPIVFYKPFAQALDDIRLLVDQGVDMFPLTSEQLYICADRFRVWPMLTLKELSAEIKFELQGVSWQDVIDQLVSSLPLLAIDLRPQHAHGKDTHVRILSAQHPESPCSC